MTTKFVEEMNELDHFFEKTSYSEYFVKQITKGVDY